MRYFPVSLNLRKKRAVVVGGGRVASDRVRALREAGAEVVVVSPEIAPFLAGLAASGEITVVARPYRSGDLESAAIVMAATDDREVNLAVSRDGRQAGVPVNVADDPERCDFIMPGVVRRGDLTIAISTGGVSPALAVRLRQRIARMIGPEYVRVLDLLSRVRPRVKSRVRDLAARKRLMYRIVDANLASGLRYGNDLAVERRIQELIDEAPTPEAGSLAGIVHGIVYIVGAGPGDPGLITVRGLECLRAADVILHDRLIGKELLGEASGDAEVIDVGKCPGDQGRMQRFIEETMIERARGGEVVCRLKGGDPFVFGRGGEEACALTEAGVSYEIIPGVTSATSAPAAAGIPVTHRGIAHSFLVMTGSRAEQAGPGEWVGAAELLRAGGTVIVMMGLAHRVGIVDRLLEAGCPADTPVALVSRGTCPDQSVWVTVLERVRVLDEIPPSPGVIVLGKVVDQRRHLEVPDSTRRIRSGEDPETA